MGLVGNIKFNKKMLIGLTLLFTIITPTLIYINYSQEKEQIKNDLEQAVFTAEKFDIINQNGDFLDIEGVVRVTNYRNNQEVYLKSIELRFFNGSEYITQTTIPIQSEDFNKKIEFSSNLDLGGEITPTIKQIITNILLVRNFDLKFQAKINYQTLGVDSELEFTNILHFRLQQEKLDLEIQYLDLLATKPFIEFGLKNPLSIDLAIFGHASINILDKTLGDISIDKRIELSSGWNDIIEELSLTNSIKRTYDLFFNNFKNSIVIRTNITLLFGTLAVEIEPTIELTDRSLSINLSNIKFSSFKLNLEHLNATIRFSISINQNLPLKFNLTGLDLELYTGNYYKLGNATWFSDTKVPLSPKQYSTISNIKLELVSNLTSIFDIILSQNLIVKVPFIIIEVLQTNYYLELDLEVKIAEIPQELAN